MVDYVLSTRAVRGGAFALDVGPSKFLAVPDGEMPQPVAAQLMSRTAWCSAVRKAAEWTNADKQLRGDVLFIVHGFNLSIDDIMVRHRRIRDDLKDLGFKGVVASFDWPSDNSALAYLPDRHRAKKSALQLVSDGITYLSKVQTTECVTNVHLLGHSTGAYVIREACSDADDTNLENGAWTASQILFAAGDVSSDSMSASDSAAQSVYRHCIRLTNYSNRHDQVLDISNAKRIGLGPRVGRVELPADAPAKAVNVDCTTYYEQLDSDGAVAFADEPDGFVGVKGHSWFFGNKIFALDLFNTLIGTDRAVVPTRKQLAPNRFLLVRP